MLLEVEAVKCFFNLSPLSCRDQACVNNTDQWSWLGFQNKTTPLIVQDIDGSVTNMTIDGSTACVRMNNTGKYKWDDAASCSRLIPVICEFNNSLTPNSESQILSISKLIQVSLVICGRYVPSFWTANPEFLR